jgi:hypothetical protein
VLIDLFNEGEDLDISSTSRKTSAGLILREGKVEGGEQKIIYAT